MSEQVKAAAERLRRIHDGESHESVYGPECLDLNDRNDPYVQDVRLAVGTFLAEHATNDAAIASCIQGAKELGQSLADAVKQIEWLRLVVQGFTSGAVLSSGGGEWAFLGIDRPVELDPDGIPVYSEELAAALRAAME